MKNKFLSLLTSWPLLTLSLATVVVAMVGLAQTVQVEPGLADSEDGTIDPNGVGNQHAWSENIGWINFEVADAASEIHITDAGFTGYAWSESHGWINMNPTGSGVLVASDGSLSGSAWGENLGYIDFSGVSIDGFGMFSGTATGTVTGTINFNCADCTVETDYIPDDLAGGSRRPRATSGSEEPDESASSEPESDSESAEGAVHGAAEGPDAGDTPEGESVVEEPEPDLDGDGVPDAVDPDLDGDDIANVFDGDTDGDGSANFQDGDDDADGIADGDDDQPQGIGTQEDVDGDAIPNAEDPDMDGDGVVNVLDENTDGDREANSEDHDDDADGLPDDFDLSPNGLGDEDDLDGDGIPNNQDPDKDGDGISNRDDSRPDGDGPSEDLSAPALHGAAPDGSFRRDGACSQTLVDVEEDSDLDAVLFLVDEGFFLCPPEGFFNPLGGVTRADLIKLVAIGLGAVNQHTEGDQWYADWWQFLIEEGVLKDDISPIRYEPRVDFLAVVAKAKGVDIDSLPACESSSFSDVRSSRWYCPLLEYALQQGWIRADQAEFNPTGLAHRSWAAGVIYRAFVK